jgi:hypothetical protein
MKLSSADVSQCEESGIGIARSRCADGVLLHSDLLNYIGCPCPYNGEHFRFCFCTTGCFVLSPSCSLAVHGKLTP